MPRIRPIEDHEANETQRLLIDTAKANGAIKKDFFGSNAADFKTLDEKKIANLVNGYDFQGKTGTGLLFFVEGMSKGQQEAGAWVTMVVRTFGSR